MCVCVCGLGAVPFEIDLHVLPLKKGTEKPEKEGQGQSLKALNAPSESLVLATAMNILYPNSGCRNLPGTALIRLGLEARGGQDPGYTISILGLKTWA